MARFYGPIGYAIPTETRPGVWKDRIEEHNYYGDVTRNSSKWTTSPDSTNDDLSMNVQISIVADPFANDHTGFMKYVSFMGARWKIINIEPQPPRLILSVGGVYNGPTQNTGTT